MKKLILAVTMLLCAQSAFANLSGTCIDRRAALIAPCEQESENLYFHQGQCEKSYEFENVYCAKQEMTDIVSMIGEVIVSSGAGGDDLVFLPSGHMTRAEQGSIKNCKEAFVLTGIPKALVDNYDPSRGEIGFAPMILKFHCMD